MPISLTANAPKTRLCTFKDAGQRIVVRLRYRIKFMIMAASTGYRHSQKNSSCHVDLLINQISLKLPRILFNQCFRTESQKTGSDELTGPLFIGLRRQQVTRQLLTYKAIIGLITVE